MKSPCTENNQTKKTFCAGRYNKKKCLGNTDFGVWSNKFSVAHNPGQN